MLREIKVKKLEEIIEQMEENTGLDSYDLDFDSKMREQVIAKQIDKQHYRIIHKSTDTVLGHVRKKDSDSKSYPNQWELTMEIDPEKENELPVMVYRIAPKMEEVIERIWKLDLEHLKMRVEKGLIDYDEYGPYS